MGRTISKEKYIQTSQIFQWATLQHYVLWFTGTTERHGRSEIMLRRLVQTGRLIAKPWNNRLIYIAPKLKNNTHYDHGLGVTEGLVRFWRSDMTATIIRSASFRGLNSVPEFGLQYSNTILLYEFCTFDNFKRMFKPKIDRYQKYFWKIDDKFHMTSFVLFVVDAPRVMLEKNISNMSELERFSFTDYQTFKSVPIGQQLVAPIYIWGGDKKPHPLKEAK